MAFILNGSGNIKMGNREYVLNKGNELFFPCSTVALSFTNNNKEHPLELLLCYPPGVITN